MTAEIIVRQSVALRHASALLNLKTDFWEYWTSFKIKIGMACVSKQYEIKTKMEHEQWLQLKILFLLGYN